MSLKAIYLFSEVPSCALQGVRIHFTHVIQSVYACVIGHELCDEIEHYIESRCMNIYVRSNCDHCMSSSV